MWCYVVCLDVRVFLFGAIVTQIMSEKKKSGIFVFRPLRRGGLVKCMLSESPGTPGSRHQFFFRSIFRSKYTLKPYNDARFCSSKLKYVASDIKYTDTWYLIFRCVARLNCTRKSGLQFFLLPQDYYQIPLHAMRSRVSSDMHSSIVAIK